mgnify:CR=1 FL=1
MSVAERPAGTADASGRGAAFASPEAGGVLTVVEPLIFEASAAGRRAVRFPSVSEAARQVGASQPELPADAEADARKLETAWTEGDMLFGKGMINDKAQLCAFMIAMSALKRARIKLKGDLTLTAVAPPGTDVEVELVWEPPWTPERMSPEAQSRFGWSS